MWTSMTSFCTLALRVAVAYIMVYALDVGYAACWLNIPSAGRWAYCSITRDTSPGAG